MPSSAGFAFSLPGAETLAGSSQSGRSSTGSKRPSRATMRLLPTAPLVGPKALEKAASSAAVRAAIDRPSLLLLEQALNSGNEKDRSMALSSLLPILISEDPHAVARFAELHTGAEREQLLRRTSQLWAARDPNAALEWAVTLSNADERDVSIADISAELANTDPARAVALRARYAPTVESDSALENFTQQWAAQDLSAALDWALARPAGRQRDLLLERIAFIRAQTAPSDAARLITDHMSPSSAQSDAVVTILHQWALRDYSAAQEWTTRFPEGPLRTRVTEDLATISRTLR